MQTYTVAVLLLALFCMSEGMSRFSYTDHLMSDISRQQAHYLNLQRDLLTDCHCPRGYLCTADHGVRRCVPEYVHGGFNDQIRGVSFLNDLLSGAATGNGQLIGFFRTRTPDQGIATGSISGRSVGGAVDRQMTSDIRGVRDDNYWGMLSDLRSRIGRSICARYDVPIECQRKFSRAVRKFTYNYMTDSCNEVKVCTSCYNVQGVQYNLFDTMYDCTVSCRRFE